MSSLKFMNNTSKRVEDYLERASKLAEDVDYKFRHGAIIVKNGAIVGSGVNALINHPCSVPDAKTQAAIHAEVAALKDAYKVDLNGATIYVARILKNGDQAMSKPCENCQKALKARGVKKVYFTINSEMDL